MTELKFKIMDKYKYPWHKDEYPESDNIVIGKAYKIDDQNGIFFHLLDYMSKEAYMPLRQISVKKVKRVRAFFKEGDIKPILVTKVDIEKGHIDVSNKYLDMAQDDIERLEKYEKLIKIFHSWLLQVINKNEESFCKNISQELWKSVMESTLWNYHISEIYENILDIRTDKKEIKDVFPLFYTKLEINEIENINICDLEKLKTIINNNINYEINVSIKLKLTTWRANSLQYIKEILNNINDKIKSLEFTVKLIINAPIYEFNLKSNKKEKIELFYENIDADLNFLLEQYNDIDFNFEKTIS